MISASSAPSAVYLHSLLALRLARPEARLEGITLQRQIPAGQEVIIGAVRDPQFGPLMMFGAGGVEAAAQLGG